MNRLTGWAVIASLTLGASVALGDEPPDPPIASLRPRRATGALEVSIAAGQGQAYGKVGRGLSNLNDMGPALDAVVGWRIDRNWLVGAYGSGGAYASLGNRDHSYGASAGLQVNRHLPHGVWVGLGFGWRGHWASNVGARDSHQGLDLARLQVGFETPVSPSFTVSPVFGASLTTFMWQKGVSSAEYGDVQDRRWSVSLFAGLLLRFELLGDAFGLDGS
jgi:hypothetical protein